MLSAIPPTRTAREEDGNLRRKGGMKPWADRVNMHTAVSLCVRWMLRALAALWRR